jgi:trehalose 6-phosphate phosphatase
LTPHAHAASFFRTPETAGLFTDFDGTLSDIVSEPSAAQPFPGMMEVLRDLGRRLKLVAVVSGRTAGELTGWFGPDFELWGLYGAERAVRGEVRLAERAEPYRPRVQEAKERASRELDALKIDGVLLEDKGIALGLHWRKATDRSAAQRALTSLAEELAARYDLHVAEGKLALELLPPVNFAKGDVVRDRAREASLEAAAFVGDDVGDLTAFDALDELAEQGLATARVAVRSAESPPDLLRRADLIVDGPAGLLRWLRSLR